MRQNPGFLSKELKTAINSNDLALAEKLAKAGAPLNPEAGELGPLCLAMHNNNEAMYYMLVNNGADPCFTYRGRNVLIYGVLGDISRPVPFKLLTELLQVHIKRQPYDMEFWEHMNPSVAAETLFRKNWFLIIDLTVPNMKSKEQWDKAPQLCEKYIKIIKASIRVHASMEKELIDWALEQGPDAKSLLNTFNAANASLDDDGLKYTEMLLKAGADANLTGSEGTTILMAKARFWDTNCVKLFLDAGADINAADCWGRTAMYSAARRKYGSEPMIYFLASHGADINARSTDGNTPLAWAAMLRRQESVETLLSLGADVNTVNSFGRTALDQAEWIQHKPIIDILKRAGAKRGPAMDAGVL